MRGELNLKGEVRIFPIFEHPPPLDFSAGGHGIMRMDWSVGTPLSCKDAWQTPSPGSVAPLSATTPPRVALHGAERIGTPSRAHLNNR
jgi:hypothetical protein